MNIELLTRLAEWLEAGAKHEYVTFDMTSGIKFLERDFNPSEIATCKTSCCIAGAAVQFFNEPQALLDSNVSGLAAARALEMKFEIAWDKVSAEAKMVLDLDADQAACLFEPHSMSDYTLEECNDPAWAARTIRHLIATSEVNWEATRYACNDLQAALELLHVAKQQIGGNTEKEIDEFIERMGRPVVRILTDSDPMNPRIDYDNVGTMFCKHGRYTLGDKGAEAPTECVEFVDFGGQEVTMDEYHDAHAQLLCMAYNAKTVEGQQWAEDGAQALYDAPTKEREQLRDDIAVILPLYLYDHSGITMSTGSFSCPWDSGQVGWIYCTKEQVEKEWGGDQDKAKACLEAEVEIYDQYLRGNVWGYAIETRAGDDVDSCWGFYGDDLGKTGMLDHVDKRHHAAMHEAWKQRFG